VTSLDKANFFLVAMRTIQLLFMFGVVLIAAVAVADAMEVSAPVVM
jgi:hypothetical protein